MSAYLLKLIISNKGYDNMRIKKLKLGLDVLIINLPKYIILFLLSYYLGILFYSLTMCSVFGILRSTSFGTHANSSASCLFSSLFIFIGGVYISKYIYISPQIYLVAFLLLLVFYYKFCPADTAKRPLLNKNHRKRLRNKTLFTLCILLGIGLITTNLVLRNIILIASIYELILILPITYKILGRSYNNYVLY